MFRIIRRYKKRKSEVFEVSSLWSLFRFFHDYTKGDLKGVEYIVKVERNIPIKDE